MALSESFKDFVLDQLDQLPEFKAKRMFGGIALLYHGSAFAKIKHDKVWLKVDDSNRDDFVKLGMEQYRYGKDGTRKLNFYEAPVDVIENKDTFFEWAQRSIRVALNGK